MRELIKLRASQINGCAYCVDMHTKDAQAMGEDAQRLHLVAVWREAPVFSPRERAALAWTEALTLLSETGAPDDVYEEVARQFGPEEQVALTLAIVAINGWNRLAVGFRQPVGALRLASPPRAGLKARRAGPARSTARRGPEPDRTRRSARAPVRCRDRGRAGRMGRAA